MIHTFNLAAPVGENSHVDASDALIVKGVKVFTPGDYIKRNGQKESIGMDAIARTDWADLLSGRPIIEGHSRVDADTYREQARGSVKDVRVSGDGVYADLIISDKELRQKVLGGDLPSVSLSFDYDGGKVEHINHLAVVKEGQVEGSRINLEKRQEMRLDNTMDNQTKNTFDLERRLRVVEEENKKLKAEQSSFDLEKKIAEAQEEKAVEMTRLFDEEREKIKRDHTFHLEAIKHGIEVTEGETPEMVESKITAYKQGVVKEAFGETTEGDLETAFELAVKIKDKNEEKDVSEKNKNLNLSKPGQAVRTVGAALQAKAEGKEDK